MKPTVAELEALLNSEDDTPVTINPDGAIGPQPPKEDDLCTAPGAADLTFGSLLCEMIRLSFTRVDGRAGSGGRHYAECNYCGGNDATRPTGQRPSLTFVTHKDDCSLAKHLPRLMAMANKDVT